MTSLRKQTCHWMCAKPVWRKLSLETIWQWKWASFDWTTFFEWWRKFSIISRPSQIQVISRWSWGNWLWMSGERRTVLEDRTPMQVVGVNLKWVWAMEIQVKMVLQESQDWHLLTCNLASMVLKKPMKMTGIWVIWRIQHLERTWLWRHSFNYLKTSKWPSMKRVNMH